MRRTGGQCSETVVAAWRRPAGCPLAQRRARGRQPSYALLAKDAAAMGARYEQIPGRLARLARFFFQAEDGIRALYVTGVQTCALPISIVDLGPLATLPALADLDASANPLALGLDSLADHPSLRSISLSYTGLQAVSVVAPKTRSEERREGKRVDVDGRGSVQ